MLGVPYSLQFSELGLEQNEMAVGQIRLVEREAVGRFDRSNTLVSSAKPDRGNPVIFPLGMQV